MAQQYPALNPLLKWLWDMISFYATDEIRVPVEFHNQVTKVKQALMSDVSGLVNSMLDFSINTATVDYIVETENKELNNIIDYWLNNINVGILGRIPIGVKALSKEYYRERWKNSSLIVMRSTWEDVEISGTTFYLPTKMWFVDGINIDVENADEDTRVIGTEKYMLKITDKITKELPLAENEKIFIQKPFNSWTDLYPVPFLIQRGLWKNLMIYDLLNTKGERIIGRSLEYLMLMKKGSEQLAMKGDPDYIYGTEELTAIKDNFKTMLFNSKTEAGTPTYVTNFDTSLEHIIPEYSKILNASLYENIEKRLLAGIGLIDIVEGTSSTRRESLLNPKPFITETENGIKDFVALLSDVILTIKQENIAKHNKYMNEKVMLRYNPIKQFITDTVRDHLRSMYDRGILSKQTYGEIVGQVDLDIEANRRKDEKEKKLDDVFYPPVINNQEQYPNDLSGQKPVPVTLVKNPDKKQLPAKKKAPAVSPKKEATPVSKRGPEAKNYKGDIEPYDGTDTEFLESLEEFSKVYEEAPYKTNKDLPPAVQKYPVGAQKAFREAFNNALEHYKNETTAFKVAWSVLKNYQKNHK
jgi:cation transport regulator ChaB